MSIERVPMPKIASSDAEVFEAHGSKFSSYVRPSRGSSELCTWRVDVAPGLVGTAHKPTREEVICCVEGQLTLTLDGTRHDLLPGDVAYFPPAGPPRPGKIRGRAHAAPSPGEDHPVPQCHVTGRARLVPVRGGLRA